jgi:hypothetical protein
VAVELSAERLSPELVLVSPPDVAAAARAALPDSFFSATAAAQPPARRTPSSVGRAAGLAAVYAASLAVTLTPLGLMLKAVPSGPQGSPKSADHVERATDLPGAVEDARGDAYVGR